MMLKPAPMKAAATTGAGQGMFGAPVQPNQNSAFGPTCLAVSIKLTLSDPTGRVLWASCVSFSRFVHNVLHGNSVLYDNHFGFTDIP